MTSSVRDRLRPSASLTASAFITQEAQSSTKQPSRSYNRTSFFPRLDRGGLRLTDPLLPAHVLGHRSNPIVTGIILSCDDTNTDGDVHREFVFIRGVHRTIDFVRGTLTSGAASSSHFALASDGTVRAAFTSPVMSRRHARMAFVDDGTVRISFVLLTAVCRRSYWVLRVTYTKRPITLHFIIVLQHGQCAVVTR